MGKLTFSCGCEFPIVGNEADIHGDYYSAQLPTGIEVDIYNVPHDCPRTWALFSEGRTKGVFQLEGHLGKTWATKVQPENMEELAALVALLRPGCVAGDSQITVRMRQRDERKHDYVKTNMRELYQQFKRQHPSYRGDIVSMDENSNTLFANKITNVIYSGNKEVFKVHVRASRYDVASDIFYNLRCTADHPLLTLTGWKKLQDIQPGERIAAITSLKTPKGLGEKHFRIRCFQHYQYRCIFCDWNEASLDVNHINGNRNVNNQIDNLCFMCPNHHRMFSEGKIPVSKVDKARKQHLLPNTDDIQWVEYTGKTSLGITDTYDITVEGPHHNFVCDNMVVHNCLRAMSGDPPKSMTQRFKDRKHKLEDVEYFHPLLEPILSTTYGVLTYQEQSMKIAVTLAGFDLQQADILRKAIGKKKADIMAKVRGDFLGGCTEQAIVTPEQAEEIFGWIQESQRYSFNKSHAVSYGEGGYWTAYLKAHFPVQFYCSYLDGAQWKQDTSAEVHEIVNDAKLAGIDICVPDFRDQRAIPHIRHNNVYFGIGNVKQIGEAALKKVKDKAQDAVVYSGRPLNEWSWLDYLFYFTNEIASTVNEAIISAGGLDYLKKSRTSMIYELELWDKLTKKEQEWIVNKHHESPYPNLLAALRDCARTKKEGGGCHNVKRVKIVNDLADMLTNPPHALHDTSDFIAWCEERYLGSALTCSKVDGCEKAVEANATCREVLQGHTGYTVVAVEINSVREVKTKRGKNPGRKMAFIGVSDSSCAMDDTVAFPETWKEYNALLHEGNTVLIQGEKDRKKGSSFVIKKVWQI